MVRSTQAQDDFESRTRLIAGSARSIAESEGWQAVTVRRLADAIGFSQPILYRHFPRGREEIVERVVLDGFAELRDVLEPASRSEDRLRVTAIAYLDWARAHPAVHEAMSTALTSIVFASDETPQVLIDGFESLRRCVAVADPVESTVRAELLWSTLHGVSQLARYGRLPEELAATRLDELVRVFS
ncbi:TetR/AcrR family transcriptional regulator [Microbacterium sp. ASV49]|uniref:TetR/AcrR family transcriptional regulator n=1 Tax=Microbacterium candidum TaxID=3041922 RepID=A0ABT7N3S7_9MICO|nr:TetR/AcrR family transcriptional regulator [Microbacterium sp. ASV49]MDL9981341.1 TetR/AcrR family transcriptional regulator [Microbacterium sp. ASV49]